MLARRGPLFVYLGAGFLTAAGIWYCLTPNVSSTIQHHHFPQVPELATGLAQPSPQPNSSILDTLSNDLLHVQYQVLTLISQPDILKIAFNHASLKPSSKLRSCRRGTTIPTSLRKCQRPRFSIRRPPNSCPKQSSHNPQISRSFSRLRHRTNGLSPHN